MVCKICGSDAPFRLKKRVLFKFDVDYFRCVSCGFLFTESPYWLVQAYQEDLKGIRDIGMVQRNLQVADATAHFIFAHLNFKGKFVDYGAGTGLFVRLMRDQGFDFYYDDPFARNIFARCFEGKLAEQNSGEYELLTAFEVFEHSADPIEDVRKMLTYSDSILFSTELQPKDPDQLANWFYLLPEAGQHIAFYTSEALQAIASYFSLKLFSDGKNFHLLTKRSLSLDSKTFDFGTTCFVNRVAKWVLRKIQRALIGSPPVCSLTQADVVFVNRLLKENGGNVPIRESRGLVKEY